MHFFVFELAAANSGALSSLDPAVVVFAMHPAESAPISAVVVTPSANGEEAEVLDLRHPDSVYSAPMVGDGQQTPDGAPPGVPTRGRDTGPNAGEKSTTTQHRLVQGSSALDELHADMALLVSLRGSDEYQGLNGQVANPEPVDSWQEDGLHFFVFQLHAAATAVDVASAAPMAVFAMHPPEQAPVSAVVVRPGVNGEEADVLDVRLPENAYMTLGTF